jgi:hypothetical protein
MITSTTLRVLLKGEVCTSTLLSEELRPNISAAVE